MCKMDKYQIIYKINKMNLINKIMMIILRMDKYRLKIKFSKMNLI